MLGAGGRMLCVLSSFPGVLLVYERTNDIINSKLSL